MQVNGYEVRQTEGDFTWEIYNPFTKTLADQGYLKKAYARDDAACLKRASWSDNHPKDGSAENICDHAYGICGYAR